LSSDAATVGAYTFRQLEAPAGATMQDGGADVLSAAIAQAEQIREEARATGEAEGRATGMAAVRAEAEPSLRALAGAREALDELRDGLVAELEVDAVTLALRLAEQILAAAVQVAPERLIDVAGQAMRRIADRRHLTLVVNPADLELMQDSVLRLQSELGGIEHCNVQADRRVGRGGVIARTEAGEIDATIEAQLSRAREIVVAELESGRGEPSS
jgi:flagellar assembly protein FliH